MPISWLSVAFGVAISTLALNVVRTVFEFNRLQHEHEMHRRDLIRRDSSDNSDDVNAPTFIEESAVAALMREIGQLHFRITQFNLQRAKEQNSLQSSSSSPTTNRLMATTSVMATLEPAVRSAANFEQQRAYSVEFQSELDRVASNRSRINVNVHDLAFVAAVDYDARTNELAASPTPVDLSTRASWLSQRASLCDLTTNNSHVQHDMRPIPHVDPETMAAQFKTHVMPLQFPDRCDTAKLLLYSHWHDVGLGSELHWIQVGLTAAFMLNRTLVIREDQGWLWVDRESCGDRTFSCLFEPLSSCEAVGRAALESLVAPQTLDQIPVVSPASMTEHTAERVVQWENAGGLAREVPMPFRYDWPRPVFWWRSHLCRFVIRPRRYVLDYVETRKRAIYGSSIGLPRASLHIRAGDKTHGNGIQVVEMEHATVDLAIERLDMVYALCSFNVAFISTRDPNSLRLLQQRASTMKYKLVFDVAQVRYGDGFHTLDLVAGHLNRTQEALQYIKDVILLTDAEYFIGAMESNVARIVAELGSAHNRFSGPPVTLLNGTYIVWP